MAIITNETGQDIVTAINNMTVGALHPSDVVDNLTTDDSTKVLSAKQGKIVNDKIENSIYKLQDLIIDQAIYPTYKNKWYWERFSSRTMNQANGEALEGLVPAATNYYNDSSTSISMNITDSYTARCTCFIYFDEVTTLTFTLNTDDAGCLWVNDIYQGAVPSCTATKFICDFRAGWNKVVVCYTEGSGGDGWVFNPKFSATASIKKMSAVDMRQFYVLNNEE